MGAEAVRVGTTAGGGALVTGCRIMVCGVLLGGGLDPGAGLGCKAGFFEIALVDLGRHPGWAVVDTGSRVICRALHGAGGASRLVHVGDGGSSTFTTVPVSPREDV